MFVQIQKNQDVKEQSPLQRTIKLFRKCYQSLENEFNRATDINDLTSMKKLILLTISSNKHLAQKSLERNRKIITANEETNIDYYNTEPVMNKIRLLKNENEENRKFLEELQELSEQIERQYEAKKLRFPPPARIQHFSKFSADESIVGDQCVICMGNVEIGRSMMRLNCDGQHTFCQICIEGWFADHNTCPICRQEFSILS